MQILTREVEAQAKLFTLDAKRPMAVKAAAKVMSNVLFNRRMLPLIIQTIVGGIDDDGPAVYVLDVLGSLLPDNYAAVGSGAQMATGVLEQGYSEKMSESDAMDPSATGFVIRKYFLLGLLHYQLLNGRSWHICMDRLRVATESNAGLRKSQICIRPV
jgi:hypothetical protein